MKIKQTFNSANKIIYNEKTLEKNNYLTHNNGDRPYRVIIKESQMIIVDENKNNKIMSINPTKIWIGESLLTPMTKFSGGYGDHFKGNSFLMYVDDYYIFIGHKIYSFKTNLEIINYVSEVGNSDVPYPYAVDIENNYYLMIEEIMLPIPEKYNTNPYDYYYDIKDNKNIINVKKFIASYKNVKQQYNVSFCTDPVVSYSKSWMNNLQAINNTTGEIFSVSEKEYINMMNLIAKEYNYKNMNCTIIHSN